LALVRNERQACFAPESSLKIPRVDYGRLRLSAEKFLREYQAWGQIPVPIEEIIELRMGLDIIPLPGLQAGLDIDAFISSDFSSITVDAEVYAHKPHRYVFSLAHEIAHAILHRQILGSFTFRTIGAYKAFLREIPDRDINSMEWQAYGFAGLLLVPTPFLEERFATAVQLAAQAGISVAKYWDEGVSYISSWLADSFGVSTQVIEKRIDLDNLRQKFGREGS